MSTNDDDDLGEDFKARINKLEANFSSKWGEFSRFIAENPKTGFASGIAIGIVLTIFLYRVF